MAAFEIATGPWLADLVPQAASVVVRAKASGRTDDPAYGALLERYYALHRCRLKPWPAWLVVEGETLAANPVYAYLNERSEFQFTGALKNLDVTAALTRVRAPALVTCGEFDEAPPLVGRGIAARVRGARLQVFDGLSHMSHIEDPLRVTRTTGAFLDAVA